MIEDGYDNFGNDFDFMISAGFREICGTFGVSISYCLGYYLWTSRYLILVFSRFSIIIGLCDSQYNLGIQIV